MGKIISGFALCFFATGPSDPTGLRLQYALKSVPDVIFTEKENDDKNTFEIFYLHFEFVALETTSKVFEL